MARCRKCDRCGKYFDPKGGFTKNVGQTIYDMDNNDVVNATWYDLCPECAADFTKWFEFMRTSSHVLTTEKWEEENSYEID